MSMPPSKLRLVYLRHGVDSGEATYLSKGESDTILPFVKPMQALTEKQNNAPKKSVEFIPSPAPQMYLLEVYDRGDWNGVCMIARDGSIIGPRDAPAVGRALFREAIERLSED